MQVTLQVLEGPDAGKAYEFRGPQTFILGRAVGGQAGLGVPRDPYFSRYHMLLEFCARGCFLRDLGSRNGSFVNDARVEHARLSSGDLIRAGRTLMEIRILAAPAQPSVDRLANHPLLRSLQDFDRGPEIGRGSLGVVHRAVDRRTGAAVAIKQLRADLDFDEVALQHFARETEVVGRLDHPRVVRLRAVGRASEALWYAMDLCRGPTLEARLAALDRLDVPEGLQIAGELLEALVHAHREGVVHRDVTPRNVLYLGSDPAAGVVLADFGLAKVFRDTGLKPITQTGEVKGTPLFMAPEQLQNARDAGPPADLYGWAATVYLALSGRWHGGVPPRDGVAWKDLLEVTPVPLRHVRPEVPPPCAEVIDRSLARDPSDRPGSAADALAALLAGSGGGRPTVSDTLG